MAHRFNNQAGRKTPKPSASERTKFRWRVRHDIETPQDKERINERLEVVKKFKEWKAKLLSLK